MITPELIKILVENESGIEDISIKSRKRKITDVRFVYYSLCRKFCDEKTSLQKIAKPLGREHSIAIHGVNKVNELLGTKTFTANDLYSKLYVRCQELSNNKSEIDVLRMQDSRLVNQYWRIRHWDLVTKTHIVLTKYQQEIKSLKQRLKIFDDETTNGILDLDERDFEELCQRNRVFLKVKKRLNKTYKQDINNQTL